MNNESSTYSLSPCRGGGTLECPHAMDLGPDFAQRLRRAVENSGWPEFIFGVHGDRLRRHHRFGIHLSACPNGCSRPHIADMGFIRAAEPALDVDACTSCGLCAEVCPDEAISMETGLPVIGRELCMRCESCVRVCPTGAMHSSASGWRVLVGGRLGRHPALARELPGLFDDDQAVKLLVRALRLFMEHYAPRKRFGAILGELGLEALQKRGA